jgi:hypothetical protein
MTKEEVETRGKREMEDRKIFRAVFGTMEGKSVLTWILNECRYFSNEPKEIDQLLTAFCNRLLGKIGILHSMNLFEDVEARMANANDRDLAKAVEEGGSL